MATHGHFPAFTSRFVKWQFPACGDGSLYDLAQVVDLILVEPSNIGDPGCIISPRSTTFNGGPLLSRNDHQNFRSLVATPSARHPLTVALFWSRKAAKNKKNGHWLFCCHCCSWPAQSPQCGLVSRSQGEARFTFGSSPNKRDRPESFHVVFFNAVTFAKSFCMQGSCHGKLPSGQDSPRRGRCYRITLSPLLAMMDVRGGSRFYIRHPGGHGIRSSKLTTLPTLAWVGRQSPQPSRGRTGVALLRD